MAGRGRTMSSFWQKSGRILGSGRDSRKHVVQSLSITDGEIHLRVRKLLAQGEEAAAGSTGTRTQVSNPVLSHYCSECCCSLKSFLLVTFRSDSPFLKVLNRLIYKSRFYLDTVAVYCYLTMIYWWLSPEVYFISPFKIISLTNQWCIIGGGWGVDNLPNDNFMDELLNCLHLVLLSSNAIVFVREQGIILFFSQ